MAGCILWAVEPLNVRLGQWETSMTMATTGMPPIPQEVLDKMTPEQRAIMEQRMKGTGTPRTTVTKSCLKKEDLDKAMTFGADDKECTRTIVTSTASKQEVHIECNRGGGKQSGTIRIEASGSESVKGAVQMTMTSGGRTMNISNTFSSKWLGPVCSEKESK
ncbi:MAG TPA: DUF3617 domain-containing protein [Terriglobales bacterium]|nr:DUF3617 domain-containing protein [Terriglobales bacterium]